MRYWNGGYISASRQAPTQSSASGVFNLRSQQVYKQASKWPLTLPPGPIQSGLKLHLDAGDSNSYSGSGTTWSDLTANNADATLVNGASYSSSDGGYIDFDGANDYATVPETDLTTSTLFNGSNAFSVSLWANIDSFPFTNAYQYSPMLFKAARRSWFYTIGDGSPTNKLGIVANQGGWGTIVLTDVLSLNTWYNVCVTYDPSSGYILYQNGSSVDTNSKTGSVNANVNTTGTEIGGYSSWSNRYFDGSISSVLVYDKTLTSTEVSYNFNTIKDRYGL